jgi:hypothetical protein
VDAKTELEELEEGPAEEAVVTAVLAVSVALPQLDRVSVATTATAAVDGQRNARRR